MATNPTLKMTVEQLKQELAVRQDILSMMNAGIPNSEIGAKYGFYPGTKEQAVLDINLVTDELVKRGEIVKSNGSRQISMRDVIIGLAIALVVVYIIKS